MKKKGLSLLMLSTFVVVIIILATTISIAGFNVLNDSKKMKFATELTYMQELVDNYKESNQDSYPVSSSVIININRVSSKEAVQFAKETNRGGEITLYEIDKTKLGIANTTYGNRMDADENDIYVVSKETGIVYYAKGLAVGNRTYFTLTDELKTLIGYDGSARVITKDGILFVPSQADWTNQNVTMIVKVPDNSQYTGISVVVRQKEKEIKSINMQKVENGYKIFNITGMDGNYDVEVSYQKKEGNTPSDSYQRQQLYSVNKIDTEAPSLLIETTKEMIESSTNTKQTYIKVNATDNVGNLKTLKYEQENIPDNKVKDYFTNNGTPLKENTILADKNAKYITIYAEDYAGNYTRKVVVVNAVLTDKDYVKTNLLVQLDGLNNTGNGHDNSTIVWSDLSGRGNHAQLYSFPMNEEDGWTFNAATLSGKTGSSEYVYVPLGLPENSSITVETVFVDQDHQRQMAVSSNTYTDNGWNSFMFHTGDKSISEFNGSIYIGGNFTEGGISNRFTSADLKYNTEVGKITTITFTYDAPTKQANVYLNGAKTSTKIFTSVPLALRGFKISGQGQYMRFCVYNRALSQEEVKENYQIDRVRFVK